MTTFLTVYGIINLCVMLCLAITTCFFGIPSFDHILKEYLKVKGKKLRRFISIIFCIIFAPALLAYAAAVIVAFIIILILLIIVFFVDTEGDI